MSSSHIARVVLAVLILQKQDFSKGTIPAFRMIRLEICSSKKWFPLLSAVSVLLYLSLQSSPYFLLF